ncbi:MAG: hypothetical protein UDQ58_02185, partial [Desulfovibrio sp.]|nr:hypothetical protein [Desulfovibrio sp.]
VQREAGEEGGGCRRHAGACCLTPDRERGIFSLIQAPAGMNGFPRGLFCALPYRAVAMFVRGGVACP